MAELTTGIIKTGNKAVAVTGTAVALSTLASLVNGVVITAPSANSGIVYIGAAGVTNTAGAAGNGYNLEPGASLPLPVADLAQVYVNGASGDYVSWVAR